MNELDEHAGEAAQHYAAAYAIHYTERDLLGALRAYGQVIELYPSAAEAQYSRAQIRNIVDLVVPAAEQLSSQVALALEHLQPNSDDSTAGAQ